MSILQNDIEHNATRFPPPVRSYGEKSLLCIVFYDKPVSYTQPEGKIKSNLIEQVFKSNFQCGH